MITNNNVWHSPVRKIVAKVELYEGSTLAANYSSTDKLKSFSIERVGEEKFFGFGVCQRLNLHLIDTKRELDIGTQHIIKCHLNCGGDYLDAFPSFKVSEVRRDENTNELSITAYDVLYAAAAHQQAELGLVAPYTILDVATACASLLGLGSVITLGLPADYNPFNIEYPTGANFEGTETLREVLNDVAEATQTVYYVDANGNLVFKMPDKNGAAVLTIGRADYIDLDSKTNRRLSDICSTTELGDNVITESGVIGTVQYIRDNAFWELREDIASLLNNALAAVISLTVNQFECSWRGNPAIEIGDKIAIVTKDNKTVYSFLYDDKIEYEGSLKQDTRWSYSENEGESADNPVTLGDALNKTFAKVDKANKQINLVVNKVDNYDSRLTAIELNTDSITSSVEQIQKNTDNRLDSIDGEIDTLTNKVEATISSEAVEIKIKEAMSSGVNSVSTETGFTFNDIGLTVSKSGSEMKTTITEDGMRVFKNDDEMLVADNKGVKAVNLHATTYLHIGTYSRFQDYENRTGCFWIV